ncbi:MAG: hypothetical protein M1834_005195 [Cirrosporium novae-zelandiae]|nr:MAG: hypothetical protein M1834_005195 [Cirrosporium novae-zelandiae]
MEISPSKISLGTTFGILVSVIIGLWIIQTVNVAYFTPLRYVPGPWYAKFTHLVLKRNVLAGRRLHYIHKLHEKYGPVVRIAPNEIDVSDLEGFREIHRIGSGFLKAPWYQKFRSGPVQDVFSMINPKQHAIRRKLLARPFSNTALRENWEPLVLQKARLAISNIKKEAQNGPVDVMKWWTLMTADIIGQVAFGEPFEMLERGQKSKYIEDLEWAAKVGGMRAEATFLYKAIKMLPLGIINDVASTDDRVQTYGQHLVNASHRQQIGRTNIFTNLVAQNEKGDGSMTDFEVAFEAAGFIVAGSGTTAVTLTYLVWAVLSNPSVKDRLEQEVATLRPDFNDVDLEGLPYLNAVISETLRLYGAAPGSLPRTVPKSGLRVGGFFIPEGTVACTQAYTIHRDPNIFPYPDRFDPNRFVSPTLLTPQQKLAFAPFGGGSRICLGMHLAWMELRHAIAHFFRECSDFRLAQSTTPASMEIQHFFLISPKSNQCEIISRKRT